MVREGGGEEEREGGREGEREGEREGGKVGGREGGREQKGKGGKEGGSDGGRKGGKATDSDKLSHTGDRQSRTDTGTRRGRKGIETQIQTNTLPSACAHVYR